MKKFGLVLFLLGIAFASSAWADRVILENLIVTGETAIGTDSINGEVFDDTTLKFKENNLRILFDDTTENATDWWITVNDETNEGANYFGVSDQNVAENITVEYTLEVYAELIGSAIVTIDGGYVFIQAGSITQCVDSAYHEITCPDPATTTIDITTKIARPEQQEFWIDPSGNNFRIAQDAVLVGTDTTPRRLVNVGNGVDDHDVITMDQLTTAEETLAAVIALGDDSVDGADALTTQLNEIESSIAPRETQLDAVETQLTAMTPEVEAAENTFADQEAQIEQFRSDVTTLQTTVADVAEDVAANNATEEALASGMADTADQVSGNSEYLASHSGAIQFTGDETIDEPRTAGSGSTASGSGASARTRDTAIGYRATVTADGSVAVGADSLVESENSVAVGADSRIAAAAEGGIALGQAARVSSGATGAAAIGQQSVAAEAQTVSVGSSTNQRRITNVAAAQQDHDAVNFSQLMQISNRFQDGLTRLAEQIDDVDGRLDESGAMMMAFSALLPNLRSRGTTQIALGLGHYSGANAVAGGIFHYLSDKILLNAGISSAFNHDSTAVQTGLVISW